VARVALKVNIGSLCKDKEIVAVARMAAPLMAPLSA
jgi:hypothetical protein